MDTTWTADLTTTLHTSAWLAALLGVSLYRATLLQQQHEEMRPEVVSE